MQIEGSHIILTGAASGIGAALLHELTQFDCHILAVDVNSVEVAPTGQAHISTFQADLTQPEAIDQIFEHALTAWNKIDIFIANAGFAYHETTQPADWTHIERIYRLNVFSPLYTLAKMETLNADKPFQMVITASAMSKLGVPGYALYSGTKAALDRFAQTHRPLMSSNGTLTLVYPITTRTNFFNNDHSHAPVLHPNQTPAFVARRIRHGIQRNASTINPSTGFLVFWHIGKVIPCLHWIYVRYGLWLHRRWQKRHKP